MAVLWELMRVILGGVAAFFGGIVLMPGLVVLWLCGLASPLCLMVSGFAGVIYWITGTPHDGELAVGYLVYAVAPFVATAVLSHYWNKFTGGRRPRRARRNIGGLRLEQDADFAPSPGRR